MAIATLKKIQILGHNSERDRLLEFLQQEGQVEVVDLKDKSDDYRDFSFEEKRARFERVTETIEKLSWLMSFFGSVGETKRSPFAAKPVVRRRELLALLRDFDYSGLYERCRSIESSLKNIEKKKAELDNRRKELSPWVALDVSLETIRDTDLTSSILGSVRKEAFLALKDSVESSPHAHMEVVAEHIGHVYLFVLHLKAAEEEVIGLLREYEFTFHHLPRYRGRVEDILKGIATEEEQLESQRLAHQEKARGFLSEETKVAALLDYFSNLEKKESAKDNLLYSRETFFLQGWIKADDTAAAQKKLLKRFETVDAYVSAPSPDDRVPVVLENRSLVEPFEVLTRIYGYPGYEGLDPTPFLAPFFFIFFGFCLGDAVYGLALVLASTVALKKLKMGWQGTRFFRLILYCGLSTIVVGALTGSWLGDLIGIPAILLQPLKNPTPLLNLALIFGIIQVWTGYAMAAYGNVRRKRLKSALLDQAPIFVLLAGLTGIGLVFLKTIPEEAFKPSLALFCLGAVVILAAHGRSQPSIGGKIGFGVLSFYLAASGYLSDVLSYSRLWALGLVTGAMASTLNSVALTMGKMIPVVGAVVAALMLVIGHVFTLLVNVLGAFVHSMRLQFVEFFSKFFDTSGKPFQPLSIENKFTVIQE